MAAGLVPCPLTTFIMTYAASREEIAFGIVFAAAFAAGTIVTVAAFPIAAILFRTRLLRLIERTSGVRHRLGRAVEVLPPAPSCCWASSQSSGGACDAAVGYG
jgi:ABC-type nickel/cobalt efflux system permease component RcnA